LKVLKNSPELEAFVLHEFNDAKEEIHIVERRTNQCMSPRFQRHRKPGWRTRRDQTKMGVPAQGTAAEPQPVLTVVGYLTARPAVVGVAGPPAILRQTITGLYSSCAERNSDWLFMMPLNCQPRSLCTALMLKGRS
jgi:hypothetical protein